ncbi:MAG TPA: hypothetical protein VMI15_02590 [Burkholderiales bacterium]|nr:hypothetical protein [Burkholderiales bacterium]
MRRAVLLLLLAVLGLAGCVAVPVDPGPVAYGPPVYAAPAPVLVQPYVGFSFYSGGHHRWERERWGHHR